MRSLCVRLAVCLTLAAACAFGWVAAPAAGETAPRATLRPAAKEAPAKTPEEISARISKQLAALQEQWTALSAEESQTLVKALSATKAAMDSGKIEDVKKTRDELSKGKLKAGWREYKQVLLTAAQQWEALAEKFGRAANQVKLLEKDRDKASPDAQASLDTLAKRIADKRRAVVERAGNCYYDAGEIKKALAIYTGLYQEIPEADRAAQKALTEKLADVLDKSGDSKSALRLYDGLYKAASAEEKKSWATFDLRIRLAAIYFDKLNDYKQALEFYKSLLETVAPDKRDTDGKWIQDKIAACEDKIKTGTGAVGGPKGGAPVKRSGH